MLGNKTEGTDGYSNVQHSAKKTKGFLWKNMDRVRVHCSLSENAAKWRLNALQFKRKKMGNTKKQGR